jgi:hypothetical protein
MKSILVIHLDLGENRLVDSEQHIEIKAWVAAEMPDWPANGSSSTTAK